MTNEYAYDYEPQEVRAALQWHMEVMDVADNLIEAALEGMTDGEINAKTEESIEYRVNAQLMVNQFREAARRGAV